jgi:hypothetical protein
LIIYLFEFLTTKANKAQKEGKMKDPPIFHSLFAFFAFVVNFLLFVGQVEPGVQGWGSVPPPPVPGGGGGCTFSFPKFIRWYDEGAFTAWLKSLVGYGEIFPGTGEKNTPIKKLFLLHNVKSLLHLALR